MKSQLGFDRQRNWSEEGKTGRLLILHKQFSSTLEVLDEMRSIRCVEHTGKVKSISSSLSVLRLTSPTLSASKSLIAVPRNTPPGRRMHLIETVHLSRKLRSWSINCTKLIKIYVIRNPTRWSTTRLRRNTWPPSWSSERRERPSKRRLPKRNQSNLRTSPSLLNFVKLR